jgi:tetratricopeptide (TPR) repeat protein
MVKAAELTAIERRYGANAAEEWRLVLRQFELGEGFALVVITVPDRMGEALCRAELNAFLAPSGKHLSCLNPETPADLGMLPHTLFSLPDNPAMGAIWVAAVVSDQATDFQAWSAGWRRGLGSLNQQRNPLRRRISVPLIIVGAPWLVPVMREIAPDLWSVRAFVARIEPEPDLDGLARLQPGPDGGTDLERHTTPAAAPDPSFALRAADRLRGRPGQEHTLADLLARAGRGFSDLGSWEDAKTAWQEAVTLYRDVGDTFAEANVTLGLGDIAMARTDQNEARSRYEAALPLFRRAGDVLGEANSIIRLGDIALFHSDLDAARSAYEQALPLYRRAGAVLGEANSIRRLGDVALARSDYDAARKGYEEALPLYRKAEDVLGEANCIMGLGDIAMARLDHDAAISRYDAALTLFRYLGDTRGEAECILRLGDIATARSDHGAARSLYETALALFRRMGNVAGEGISMQRLGGLAMIEGDRATARADFEKALALFEQVHRLDGVASAHQDLAGVMEGTERHAHVTAAAETWNTIGRPARAEQVLRRFR